MQASATIPTSLLRSLYKVAFSAPVTVSTVYSDFGEHTKYFNSPDEAEAHRRGRSFESYALHYHEAGGHVAERRISLDPKKCDGHTFRYSVFGIRYSVEGWGLIQIQIKENEHNLCECRIVVNTLKRAQTWAVTYPAYEDPNQWNWKIVEKHARKLIRYLKKSAAHQGAPGDVGAGTPPPCAN